MIQLNLNKIFVIILSTLFLLTGNITYSFSFPSCDTEECCQRDCCGVVEHTESIHSDMTYSKADCCEYDQNYDADSKPVNLFNNSNNHIPIIAKQLHSNFAILSNPLPLTEKPLRQSPLHHSITILRI